MNAPFLVKKAFPLVKSTPTPTVSPPAVSFHLSRREERTSPLGCKLRPTARLLKTHSIIRMPSKCPLVPPYQTVLRSFANFITNTHEPFFSLANTFNFVVIYPTFHWDRLQGSNIRSVRIGPSELGVIDEFDKGSTYGGV
jgi:hypothetical protein